MFEESRSCMVVNSRVSHERPVLNPWFRLVRIFVLVKVVSLGVTGKAL